MTLKSFDGTKAVEIQVAKLISFDQKLSLAKEKIDEYLTLKTNGADAEIQTLITRAFDVKNGKVDAKQILSLKAYPITHELWKEAMSMIDVAYRDWETDRKSTRLNSSHRSLSRMPSSA